MSFVRRFLPLLVALVLALPAVPGPAHAAGTLAWPHFLKIHVENRRADTRVIVDAGWAGKRWVSQPGVLAGDYLVRVDESGFVRSLDDKLAFFPNGGASGDLVVHVQAAGVDGTDSFPFTPGSRLTAKTPTYAAGPGNMVTDVQPYIPRFTLPMDFEINVTGICRPNQYLQVAPEWTNTVWRTPDGTGPGTYRVRLNADGTVTSLDGKVSWSRVPAQPWDHGYQILGVLIVHSCDPKADGADIVGFGRNTETGELEHMTTWAQAPDGGYGWQPFNCGSNGSCSSEPRPNGFHGGNWIVLQRPAPVPPPVNLAATRLNAGSQPAVSVAVSQAQFAAGSANEAVLARWDKFADALAGIPLALKKQGPLLLTSSVGVEAEVVNELRRVVRRGGTVWLLGGTQALSDNVEATVRNWGFVPRRLAGVTRVETSVAVAKEIGSASTAFVVNAWNFPDALSAGSAAGAVQGGVHVLLTNVDSVPTPTAVQLETGLYTSRVVFGGVAAVNDATYGAVRASERVWGADRDATAAAAAGRFYPSASTVWLAGGHDFVGGITGGAMAARQRGPLVLASGGLGDALRGYLKTTKPTSGYVVGGLDDGVVTSVFGQPAR